MDESARPAQRTPSTQHIAQFERFHAARLARDTAAAVRPGCSEKWLPARAQDQRLPPLLYIHGFAAGRAEGEFVVDRVAHQLGTSVYYLRLPGHGTTPDEHAETTGQALLDDAERVLRAMQPLGERVVVIGTSMGALIAMHLAATMPELVQALVLASPFISYSDPRAWLLQVPGGLWGWQKVHGQTYDAFPSQGEGVMRPGFEQFWYRVQRYDALRQIEWLRRHVATRQTFAAIACAVLMLWYPRDPAAKPTAMLDMFEHLGGSAGRHPLSRAVRVELGHHVLLSEWAETDHDLAEREIVTFIHAAASQAMSYPAAALSD